ncbi:MAG: alanine--tRNA ligase [Fimbriimonadaceae bacterium]|nr:alanine--tRNA ligase [Fimbriimonadaceae bacterium]
MTVRELRERYLAFFEGKEHLRYPSGSLIPYDVTGRLDESLLFNGAGMIQFKPYFRGVAQPERKRLTTVQKCVRTGDIDEVGDDTHLTFFEMLGNFSFGDYFKAEAIRFSWEFLTDAAWLSIPPARLSFTVFEADDEAIALWRECGAELVFRLGEETNYWPAGAFTYGPPGPCGPNSEMYYWVPDDEPAPDPTTYTVEDWLRDEADRKWVEIWNDVFITYEWQGDANPIGKGYIKTGMPELPFRSIDTGMGLERTAMVLSGLKNVYATDVFTPIFAEIDAVAGSITGDPTAARRIIADHIRTATFCIGDGVLPGNSGRGYVLRRLIRRAVLKGDRVLGIAEPFLYRVYEGVAASMGDAYPEIRERAAMITETLRNEEILFRRTLRAGTERIADLLHADISGEDAFRLYDTFGFPLEITKELAAEAGVAVDEAGYEAALVEAQTRSRAGQELETVYGAVGGAKIEGDPSPTEFLGYAEQSAAATVVAIRRTGERIAVALDRTPFYGESGGQVGDTGTLDALTVVGTTKSNGVFWHALAEGAVPPAIGATVTARVDAARRQRVVAHHTATHLLHLALREHLGRHATQAGSYVGPDRLRFDFTHGAALSPEDRAAIESRVNELARANDRVTTYVDITPDEARARGAMALFGEKYGDKVRMVEIGASRELCGGIHVGTAAETLPFRILSESSAQSGVRRIEAVAGIAAMDHLSEERATLETLAARLKSPVPQLAASVDRLLESLADERRRRERAERQALTGGNDGATPAVEVGAVRLITRAFGEVDPKVAAEAIDNAVAADPKLVMVGAVVNDGKVTFTAKVGADALAAGAHAGNLLREVAKVAGGGGGGRADFATAGGKLPEKVDSALAVAVDMLKRQVSG